MSTRIIIPDDKEKAALQARHRQEATQTRDRVKAQKQRTHRLIQEGALLEKVLPGIVGMDIATLEQYLRDHLL